MQRGTQSTGELHAARRPMLLALVYGVSLMLIGAASVAVALVVGAHFSAAILETTVAHDRALIGLWADTNLSSNELRSGAFEASRRTALEEQLRGLAGRAGILELELRHPDGEVLVSTRGLAAADTSTPADHGRAAAGAASARLIEPGAPGASAIDASHAVLQEFLPLVEVDGEVAGVVGIVRDARPFLAQLEATRNDVILIISVGGFVLAVVLMFVFRAAHRRLKQQGSALIESARRDPLTGLLNHGAAVAALAERVELARSAGASMAIALIDVDNFRLLNDTHGHAAGDAVLIELARQMDGAIPAGTSVGRYGPDEFVVVGPPVAVEIVEQAVERLRGDLRKVAVRFGTSEALPITVSAGVAIFPATAAGATDLLVAAANALADAKASGGDAVRSAGVPGNSSPEQHTTFSALQGLVLAVDTKDRYTKRHSEDVAAYAVFLGRQLGLNAKQVEQLRVAGLLHDVGKVGIPDAILRKPAALTPEERRVIEQHVALGDLIVRDLPDVDVVRAGVRHHHERWDGNGYLDHLAGDEIPLIARILAVCDAFSAMTTTRPYRKALGVGEALKRLGDAAGSQLDERIVATFVHAMDTAADAPRPDDSARGRLWLPARAA